MTNLPLMYDCFTFDRYFSGMNKMFSSIKGTLLVISMYTLISISHKVRKCEAREHLLEGRHKTATSVHPL